MRSHYPGIFLALLALPALADGFGSGEHQFEIGFVLIGNPGNLVNSAPRSYGAVDYLYRMGVHEVSRGMIESYNALSVGPTITMSDMSSSGGNGANRPATGVSWNEAARFVNWLNTSKGHSAAYKFSGDDASDGVVAWVLGDDGYDAANRYRNTKAQYFIPNLNEWYKSAYYDPEAKDGAGGYWRFATGSDTAPTPVPGGVESGTAVIAQTSSGGPADVTNAGGLSPYGTMGQNGNVTEWTETWVINASGETRRLFLGGSWTTSPSVLEDQTMVYAGQESGFFSRGFRVASVPEPSVFLTCFLGIAGVALRRRR